ncbi:MAG: hypothetical protein MUF48_06155 [Pirellulaceae bacterium]|jgi:outer membrane protein assembly factor BamB|nr:hypothetical protein [Pirellulaceae bacterium]
MTTPRAVALALGLLLCGAGPCPVPHAQEWTRYGHDGALTGRSPIRGRIATPRVAWTFDLAGRQVAMDVEPVEGAHALSVSAASVATERAEPAAAAPLRLDLDGRGTLRDVTETFHERWAQILPDVPGPQRVAWNHTWTDQAVCRLQLFAYDQNPDAPRLVWETDPPEGTIFQPLNVVFDIDHDGVQEICVAAHYRVMIFEGTTGRKETELRYHASRPYGWFGIADIDGDGAVELVTIGDFQSHVDVLEYDPQQPEPERLRVKWRRDIEQNIEERTKWPQIGPRPVVNVAGDARLEIVLNVYNDLGDGQWHVVVLDAESGHTLVDLPRRFSWGSCSLDGGSSESLFVTTTDGVLVHELGHCQLLHIEDGDPRELWSQAAAAWCTADWPRLGATWSTTASQGMRHVLTQSAARPVFFVKTWQGEQDHDVTLCALQMNEAGAVCPLWQLDGVPDSTKVTGWHAASASGGGSARIHLQLAPQQEVQLRGRGVRPLLVVNRPLGGDTAPPIVARLGPGAACSVIVEAPGEAVCAVDPPASPDGVPRLRWQTRGRGMRDGSRVLGFVAADLDEDGAAEILAADRAAAGYAVLRAYDGAGGTRWEQAFPHIPGALPVWNVGALTFWWPGHYRTSESIDVLVNTRRGLMHSDVGQLLQGADGSLIWQQDRAELAGEFRWGWGGAPPAVVDVAGDARDELVCLHPVCLWIAEGGTGELLSGRNLAARTDLPAWAAYGEPMVVDFLGRNTPQILLDSPYILALLELDGTPLWHGLPRSDYPVSSGEGNAGETTSCRHALLDLDGDGRWEIASAGYGDGVRAIDPTDGRVLWRLAAALPTCPRSTATNIDGQGGDELLYVADRELIAVTGDRESGRVLWRWTGPSRLSMPAIADVDGDGTAEIVVQDADAVVYCLDQ